MSNFCTSYNDYNVMLLCMIPLGQNLFDIIHANLTTETDSTRQRQTTETDYRDRLESDYRDRLQR